MENIKFQNVTVSALAAFELRMTNRESHPPFPERIHMKNLSFDGVTAYSARGSYLLGFDNADLSDVAFQNVKIYFNREDSEDDRFPCNYSDVRDKKAAFYLKKAKNIRFENVRFVCEEGLFDHELLCEETENVALVGSDVAVSHVKKEVVET